MSESRRSIVGSPPAGRWQRALATLTGSVYPHGATTGYHFEYGPATFYGSTTPDIAAAPA
jgi:hypothetical protein